MLWYVAIGSIHDQFLYMFLARVAYSFEVNCNSSSLEVVNGLLLYNQAYYTLLNADDWKDNAYYDSY